MPQRRLRLPQRAHIAQVDHSDPLEYYYRPHTAALFRQRLQLALDLLGPSRYGRLLEAGYGSGILLPSLAERTDHLFGMDLHRRTDLVQRMLAHEGMRAQLQVANVEHLPYGDATFEAVVCISTLEHLHGPELNSAVDELWRVLRPGGVAIAGVPSSGRVMDFLFHAIGFQEIEAHHVSTSADIAAALAGRFDVERTARLPGAAPAAAALYTVFRCRRR